MTPVRMMLLVSIATSACASASPEPTSTTTGGESEPVTETADAGPIEAETDAGVDASEDASAAPRPVDLTMFSPSVRARLEALPPLPVDASAMVVSITLFDASLVCGFLDAHVRHEGTVAASCPDGSPVVLGGECNPASVLALRHTFGEACAVRFGDYLACEIAARESPCAVGYMRADLPECEAVNACLATQMPPPG